jgi:hypothetical protein
MRRKHAQYLQLWLNDNHNMRDRTAVIVHWYDGLNFRFTKEVRAKWKSERNTTAVNVDPTLICPVTLASLTRPTLGPIHSL